MLNLWSITKTIFIPIILFMENMNSPIKSLFEIILNETENKRRGDFIYLIYAIDYNISFFTQI